jgi:hypothetical protein
MTEHEYYTEIRSLAESVAEEAEERGGDLREAAQVALHETIAGHQWVIYTHHNWSVLKHSRNDCAMFECLGAVEATDWGTLLAQGAYYAMEADVSEAIDWDGLGEDEDDDA